MRGLGLEERGGEGERGGRREEVKRERGREGGGQVVRKRVRKGERGGE